MGFRTVERPDSPRATSHGGDAPRPQVGVLVAIAAVAIASGLCTGTAGLAAFFSSRPEQEAEAPRTTATATPSTGSDLLVLRRIYPEFPAAGRFLGDQRCLADVSIAPDGVPYEVTVARCPEVFVDPTRTAILQWRWAPLVNGTDAHTTIAVVYKMK
jgi:hypothetical protein